MSHKSTPVIGMSIILVLILAVAGVAFTNWNGSILVNGAATTSGVKVEWDTTAYLGCADTIVTFVSPTEIQLTRADAVQGDTDTCSFTYANNGTFPVTITAINVAGAIPGELDVTYTDGVGSVMDPCPALSCQKTLQLTYTVGPNAQPFTTYNFSVEVVAEQ
jgi:hypothetical protein